MIAGAIVRHRRLVLAIWLILIPLGLAGAHRMSAGMVGITRLEGSESARVEDLLAERFRSPASQSLLLVARRLPPNDPPRFAEMLEKVTTELAAVPGVRLVTSILTVPDTLLLGSEAGSAVIVVGVDSRVMPADSIMTRLRESTTRLTEDLRSTTPDITLRWTGGAALAADLRQASARDSRRAELRALPVLLIVLLVAFRSVAAAVIPLVLGALAIGVGLGVALLLAWFGAPSTLLGNIASILGLALGIDYSLLMITRFREALARERSARDAAIEAGRTAGPTIALSGAAVALGFAGLLLVPIPAIRSVALGGVGVAAVAVALATTLLPAVLSWLGARVDRGSFGRRPSATPSAHWYRIGRVVTAHPLLVLVIAGAPLLLLSVPALRLSPATPSEDWLPRSMESARAFDDLERMGRSGVAAIIPVLIDLEALAPAGAERWQAVARFTDFLAADPRVGEVRAVPTLASLHGIPVELFLNLAPANVVDYLLSADGAMTRIDVVPAPHVRPTEIGALVRAMRDVRFGETAARAAPLVGGTAAFQTDFELAVERAFPWVVGSVVGSILLALSIGFRSVLIPLKATLLNLLTVGAGLGALVLVFQDGFGSQLFGVSGPLSGVFPGVPIMAFCIVFGLSMDYEVFLMGRIAEARRNDPNGTEAAAIVEGLARTGRVITFAATLMIIVFTAFAFGEYLPAAFLGFAMAVAVLADVTLVRLAVGPALLTLAGRWNWWPGSSKLPPQPQPQAADEASASAPAQVT